ncbi:S41 family peptidase [Candidatus Azambacteria bacterium]|nr:S41 family peptidase [Candidatus Azambacteria bacterium]
MNTKKIFASVLIAVIFAGGFSIGDNALAGQTYYPDGTLLKAKGESRIYTTFRGHKYWLRTPKVFSSYRFLWKNIREVDAATLASLPDVNLISPSSDNTKIYYVESAKARWIVSPEAFNANAFDWNAIQRVNAADFESYEAGPDVTGDISGKTATLEINQVLPQSDAPAGVDFSVLWNVWKTIEEKYRNGATLDRQKLVQGAAEGMIKSLGDPYTVFFRPDDAKKFSQDVAGEFFGIGAELGYKKGVVVIAPLKGLPAETAGVKAGDKIVKINGESTIDMTVEDAVARIRGEKGTKVTLTIERSGQDVLLEFVIERALVKVATVEWSRKTGDIFYIKINNFFGEVEMDFVKAAKEAQAQGMKKLVLDMRNNPGGLLDASINIASEFIPKGNLVVSADFGEGKNKEEFASYGGGVLEKMPIVVLVNGGSASASEILAGALKDSRNAVLIGEKTFGKGTIQEVLRIPGGSSLKVTIAQWLRPSGKPIDGLGIDPDIAVELTDQDRVAGRDPQLDKALQVAQGLSL